MTGRQIPKWLPPRKGFMGRTPGAGGKRVADPRSARGSGKPELRCWSMLRQRRCPALWWQLLGMQRNNQQLGCNEQCPCYEYMCICNMSRDFVIHIPRISCPAMWWATGQLCNETTNNVSRCSSRDAANNIHTIS